MDLMISNSAGLECTPNMTLAYSSDSSQPLRAYSRGRMLILRLTTATAPDSDQSDPASYKLEDGEDSAVFALISVRAFKAPLWQAARVSRHLRGRRSSRQRWPRAPPPRTPPAHAHAITHTCAHAITRTRTRDHAHTRARTHILEKARAHPHPHSHAHAHAHAQANAYAPMCVRIRSAHRSSNTPSSTLAHVHAVVCAHKRAHTDQRLRHKYEQIGKHMMQQAFSQARVRAHTSCNTPMHHKCAE
eukprot:6203929-Pleurochrysis_carterae.AAC.1